MPEITIISGKGGTGKTSITAAFAHLAENKVICDLDVDAPDLHILLNPKHDLEETFVSGHLAEIDPDKCTQCGDCLERCEFKAIHDNGSGPRIDPLGCEGCKVCVTFCPADAINWNPRECGQWYVSQTRFGPMVHAQLYPGQENSGLLVSLLRQHAREMAEEQGLDLILSDGSPGIGCPVISSLTGTTLAVLVTEPTPSGMHDLIRVADLCDHFQIKAVALINKYDLNEKVSDDIEKMCAGRGIEVIGRLVFDPAFTEAMVQRQVITEYMSDGLADDVRAIWKNILDLANMAKAA
jgi:MinD superfamily P-loop ATPase